MTPEERSLLESTHQLARENNQLLQKLNRRARLSTLVKVLYWVVIIGLSFGAFYFIQPYINFLHGALGGGSTTTTTNSGSESYSQQIEDLLK